MLKVRGLTVDKPLLTISDISFEANKGEIVVLLGPNASGKSAILERIADPDLSYTGTVIANHFNGQGDKEKYRHQIGYLPEKFSPPPHLTGYEFLEIVGSLYNLDRDVRTKRILHLSNTLDNQKELYTVMEKISEAAKQKVGLTAALLSEPSVLLLDEPLQFLDEQSQQQAYKLLKTQAKAGSSVIVATNNLDLAQEIGEYFLLIDKGERVADGTVAQLSHQSRTSKDLADIYQTLIDKE